MNPSLRIKTFCVSVSALALVSSASVSLAEPWSFGVMADTQWVDTGSSDNDTLNNPNTVAASIIKPLNTQFIGAGVKFVIQVGDLVDVYSSTSMAYRASLAQPLYDAGIGFFPLRGNHERAYAAVSNVKTNFPQMAGTGNLFGATNYSAQGQNSLSYSFDYNNARFVLLDQFPTSGSGSSPGSSATTISSLQQPWISSTLADKPAVDGQAFVFSHKNLIGENHTDILFGADPSSDPTGQTTFIDSLAVNGVRYYLSGHDHIHQRSLIKAPNSDNVVEEIIGASDSNKFYIPLGNSEVPGTANNDTKYNNPHRETSIQQERYTVGYYIFTVDGPRVTGQFYSAVVNSFFVNGEYNINSTPQLNFTLRETFGYSLNGKQVQVPEGVSYAMTDGYQGTSMAILNGTNSSTDVDGSYRSLTKTVNTGWAPKSTGLASDVLSLWGLAGTLGSKQTDVYTLSVSFDKTGLSDAQLTSGAFGLASRDAKGRWLNAVDLNFGGSKQFVSGPWNISYTTPGTYGVDLSTNPPTAWAVVNHESDFAVAGFAAGDPAASALISRKAGPIGARVWTIKVYSGPNAVNNASINSFGLTQTGGATCTPQINGPSSLPMPIGNIAPQDSATGNVQIDFTGCPVNARFTASISYSGDGGLNGSKMLYNQFQ